MRTRSLLVVGILLAVLGWERSANALLCYPPPDPKNPTAGAPMKWPTMPIKYLINASKVEAAKKAAFIQAVQNAFATYEKIPCTDIKFTYGGETTSVDPNGLKAILVNFSDVAGDAYWTRTDIGTYDPPDIIDALIQMTLNGPPTNAWKYIIGQAPNSIDVQSATTQMIAAVLGYYAGPGDKKLDIRYDYIKHDLTPEQIEGAQYLYFKAGTGCTQPAKPSVCTWTPTPSDGGKRDGSAPPQTDGYTPPAGDGGPTPGDVAVGGDASLPPPKEDGCCRVSHAGNEAAARGLAALAGLALLLALRRRRR